MTVDENGVISLDPSQVREVLESPEPPPVAPEPPVYGENPGGATASGAFAGHPAHSVEGTGVNLVLDTEDPLDQALQEIERIERVERREREEQARQAGAYHSAGIPEPTASQTAYANAGTASYQHRQKPPLMPPMEVPQNEPEKSQNTYVAHQKNQVKEPVRRVGTFTMGVSLIACGALLLSSFFISNFDLFAAARLAPLILVFLGLEILVSNIIFKNFRLKYDFLSMFMCFVMITGALGVSALPRVVNWVRAENIYDEQYYTIRAQLGERAQNDTFNVLKDNEHITNADFYVSSFNSPYDYDAEALLAGALENSLPEPVAVDVASLYESASGYMLDGAINMRAADFNNKQEFAQACYDALQALLPLNLPISRISFCAEDENAYFSLDIYDRYQMDDSAETLAKSVAYHNHSQPDDQETNYDTEYSEGTYDYS